MKKYSLSALLSFGIASIPFINPIHLYPDGDFTSQILAFTLSVGLVSYSTYKHGKIYFSTTPLLLFYLLLAILLNPKINEYSYSSVLVIFAATLLSATIQSESKEPIIWGLIAGTILNCVAGYIQLFNLTEMVKPYVFWEPNNPNATIYGNIAQRNLFTSYIFIGLLCAIHIYSNESTTKNRYILVTLLLLISPLLAFSASRSIFLYLAASIILIFIFSRTGRPTDYSRRFLKVLFYSLATLLACQVLATVFANQETGMKRLAGGDAIRVAEWQKSLSIILNNLPWGTGWGNYAHYSFLEQLKESNSAQNITWTHSHNIVINLLSELGIAAAPALVGLALISIQLTRSLKNTKKDYFSVLSVITLALHSLLEYPLWYTHFLILVVAIIGSSNLKRTEIPLTKITQTVICGACLSLLTLSIITSFKYSYLVENTYKSSDQLSNIEKTANFTRIAANPALSFAADLSNLNFLPIASGNLRLCLIYRMAKSLPTYTLLDKLAIELYTAEENKLAQSVVNSRYKAYPTESEEVFLEDIKGFSEKDQKAIKKDIASAKENKPEETLYKFEEIRSCSN